MKTVKLGEVAEINPRAPRNLAPESMVSFVPMAAVSEVHGAITAPEERPAAEVTKGYSSFARGDVLLAKITPCFENGKAACADIPHEWGFGSTEYHVMRPHDGKLCARYLLHFLRRDSIRHAGELRMTGAGGQKRVPVAFLQELEIPLPALAEQKRIAAILDAAAALRAQRRRALARLDDLARSLFLHHFGDPVSNPKGWPVVSLEELGALDRGVSKHRPRNDPALLGGNHPLIQTGDVANSGGYIRTYASTYSDLGLRQSKMWPAGTLCITIAANIGKTGIMQFDACFPDSVVGFIANGKAEVEYVHRWFGFVQKHLEDSAPESAQKNINLGILRNHPIPLPPVVLQQRFARELAAVEAQKARQSAQLARLDALFASLQSGAFTGAL